MSDFEKIRRLKRMASNVAKSLASRAFTLEQQERLMERCGGDKYEPVT